MDLNNQRRALQARALPLELSGQLRNGEDGVQPPSTGYQPIALVGACAQLQCVELFPYKSG
jgi:hypothetical protein